MALVLLTAVLVLSLVLIALGLPGLWVMIASAVMYNILVGSAPIGWFTLIAVGVLAAIAEIIGAGLCLPRTIGPRVESFDSRYECEPVRKP